MILNDISNKIFSDSSYIEKVNIWKKEKKKIVFTNGCFDIIHFGHIYSLSSSRDCGDILIVGLNTDNSIRKLKGKNRPLQDGKSRSIVLASLSFVDMVVFFDDDTPIKLIETIQPDILIKSTGCKPEEIVGYKEVKNNGGQVISLNLINGYSTTNIENKMK